MLSIALNDVDLPKSLKGSLHEVIEPCFGDTPSLVLLVEFWDCPTLISQPNAIVSRVGKFSQYSERATPLEYDRHFDLPPDAC